MASSKLPWQKRRYQKSHARQPSAAGHAASVPTNSANGRDRTPSNCSHATSPPSGSAMSYGRKYGRPCLELASTPRRRHQRRSDAVHLCVLSRSEDSALALWLVRHPHPPPSLHSVPPPRCSRNIEIRTPLPHSDGCAKLPPDLGRTKLL